MKNFVFILVAVCLLCFLYGFVLGSIPTYVTQEGNEKKCAAVCEPNGGMEKCLSSIYCACENGASFSKRDLY